MGFSLQGGNHVELTVQGHYEMQEIDNVFWYRVSNGPLTEPPVLDASLPFLTKFRDEVWRDVVLPLLSIGYVVDRYILRRVVQPFPGGTPKFNFNAVDVLNGDPILDVGSNGIDSLPTYASVNIWQQATPAGKSGRGRKSMGPITEFQTQDTAGNGNLLTDAALALWQTVAGVFAVTLPTGAGVTELLFSPVVASLKYYVMSPPQVQEDIFRIMTSATARRALGSQVSRKRKNSFQ